MGYDGNRKRMIEHHDGVHFREIMPGKCDNLDDIQNEWGCIKLSYEVLSDMKYE